MLAQSLGLGAPGIFFRIRGHFCESRLTYPLHCSRGKVGCEGRGSKHCCLSGQHHSLGMLEVCISIRTMSWESSQARPSACLWLLSLCPCEQRASKWKIFWYCWTRDIPRLSGRASKLSGMATWGETWGIQSCFLSATKRCFPSKPCLRSQLTRTDFLPKVQLLFLSLSLESPS